LKNYTSKFRPHLRHKFPALSLPLPLLIFSLKWRLQSPFLLLHSATIDIQEAKDSIDEEYPRPTSSTWSYIKYSLKLKIKWDGLVT